MRSRWVGLAAVLALGAAGWLVFGHSTKPKAPAQPEVPVKRLGIVLSRYCVDRRYLQKMQPGAVRVDLDGNPAGIVTQEEAAIAADKLRLQTAAYRVWQKAQAAERAQVESDSPPPRRLPVLPANDFASVSAVNA